MMKKKHLSRQQFNEYLLTISRITAQRTNWKSALDEIIGLVGDSFLFDRSFIYQLDHDDQLQVIYARSGQSHEPDQRQMDWVDVLTHLVVENQRTVLQQPDQTAAIPPAEGVSMFLGVPLSYPHYRQGAMVFIRYGGLPFTPGEMQFVDYLSQSVAILIERQTMLMDHELLEYQKQQAQMQEDFISHITHELRNPLGCIKGYTTTLLRSDITWSAERQQEFLQIIDQETDRLQEMIDNLLESARIQSGQFDLQFQPLRLDKIITDWVARASQRFPEAVIHLEIPQPLEPIIGDSARLLQVFENILNNALKHAQKSDIWIKIISDQSDYVLVSFEDNGPGIPEQYLSRIFDRFFKVPLQPPNIPGSGLGLFICRQIVQAHHGDIKVQSTLGKGTTFFITLPFTP